MTIFYSKCRKKHALRECPTNSTEVCRICEAKNSTNQCPYLPEIKAAYAADQEVVNALYVMAPQQPSQPHLTCTSQSHFIFPYAHNHMSNVPMPWQT